MNITDFQVPYTSTTLLAKMEEQYTRSMIAEGLLYEQTTLMIAADPGCGKSTISTQIMVELAAGLPIFGYFPVPKPVKVLYIQTERSIIEIIERLKVIRKTYPVQVDNILITDEYQRLNLLNPTHADIFLDCLKRDAQGVEVIILDPIYSTVGGGLSGDTAATMFTRTFNRVQKELDCALYYNHHTIKPAYEMQDGKYTRMEKDDPFYGSQWLKAHVTGSYYMRSADNGVIMTMKKDNYRLLAHKIVLEYNPETELCHVAEDKLAPMDKLNRFIGIRRIDGKSFDFKEIQSQTGVCTRTLRELLMHTDIKGVLISVSGNYGKKLYKVKAEK